ncbi:TetR/AcrR family transcriptional regulator, partial [Mesorhizobium sp. M2D.F.Ca.ET.147.01.1.1]
LINGASSQAAQRIANSEDPEATSKKAIAAFKQLLEGLLRKPEQTTA